MYQKAILEIALEICSLPSFEHSYMPINSKAIKILPESKNVSCYSLCQSIKNIPSSPSVKALATYATAIFRNLLMFLIVLNLFPNIWQQFFLQMLSVSSFPHLTFLCFIHPHFCKASVFTSIFHLSSWNVCIFKFNTLLRLDCSEICHVLLVLCISTFFVLPLLIK